jgi:hypothetical protein
MLIEDGVARAARVARMELALLGAPWGLFFDDDAQIFYLSNSETGETRWSGETAY